MLKKLYTNPKIAVPLGLLLLGAAAYGLLAPELGYYWDGWAFTWIPVTYGAAGQVRYYASNRPFWGLTFQAVAPLLNPNPFNWQMWNLLLRWLSAVGFWLVVRAVQPRRSGAAVWAAALWLLYPGFMQGAIANLYSHMFLMLVVYFASLLAMIKMVREPARRWLWGGLALAGAFADLFTLEYLFGLELLRLPLLWLLFGEREKQPKPRLTQTIRYYLPYALAVGLYLYWRVFVLSFQTYDPELLNAANETPLGSLLGAGVTLLKDAGLTGLVVWLLPFKQFFTLDLRSLTGLLNLGVVVFGVGVMVVLMMGLEGRGEDDEERPRWACGWVGAGLLALAAADLPFRIPDLIIRLAFPNDRFTLPMMTGAALLLVGLVYALVRRPAVRTALLAVLVGLAAGFQFYVAADYRQDWKYQQALYWQLLWRAPSIEPGTTLISPELPLIYETDISLTAPLNWLYAPGDDSQAMPYLWTYIPQRIGGVLPDLEPGHMIAKDYLSSAFVGTTDQVLAIYYEPPACLRVLHPVYDAGFPGLGGELRRAAALSDPAEWVRPELGPAPELLVFGAEPDTEVWCYYLQKADLARQQGDWETVAALGDIAFALADSPNHATERLPFIEAYARLGQFKKAERLSYETYRINPRTDEMLCALWGRVAAAGLLDGGEGAAVLASVTAEIGCVVDSQP